MSNWQTRRIQLAAVHQNEIFNQSVNGLDIKARVDKKIILIDNRKMIEFVSCSYLGIDNHPLLSEAAKDAIDKYGVQFAVSRTRVKPVLFTFLEKNLSLITGYEDAVCFNAVTPIHLGVFPILAAGELPGFPILDILPSLKIS